MDNWTVKRIDQMERAFGGIFIRARAALGASGFGMNIIDLPPMSGDAYPEHDHLHDGQEEIYFLLSGVAELILPGQVVDLEPLVTMVRVAAVSRRRLRSGPDGARVMILGATPGKAYVAQENSRLGGPETFGTATASTTMNPNSPPPVMLHRGRY